jgi:hypothetical protein
MIGYAKKKEELKQHKKDRELLSFLISRPMIKSKPRTRCASETTYSNAEAQNNCNISTIVTLIFAQTDSATYYSLSNLGTLLSETYKRVRSLDCLLRVNTTFYAFNPFTRLLGPSIECASNYIAGTIQIAGDYLAATRINDYDICNIRTGEIQRLHTERDRCRMTLLPSYLAVNDSDRNNIRFLNFSQECIATWTGSVMRVPLELSDGSIATITNCGLQLFDPAKSNMYCSIRLYNGNFEIYECITMMEVNNKLYFGGPMGFLVIDLKDERLLEAKRTGTSIWPDIRSVDYTRVKKFQKLPGGCYAIIYNDIAIYDKNDQLLRKLDKTFRNNLFELKASQIPSSLELSDNEPNEICIIPFGSGDKMFEFFEENHYFQ